MLLAKMRTSISALTFVLILAFEVDAAPFRNLDFEEATIATLGSPPRVDPLLALPGWTVESPYTAFDTLTLGSSAQIIMDDQWQGASSFPILQGIYSLLLVRGESWLVPAAIRQTGTIPDGSRSLLFAARAYSEPLVSIDALPLTVAQLANGQFGADISPYAGRTVELRFTTENGLFIDDIRFSPVPVPEPGSVGMIGLGMIGIVGHGIRRRFL